MNTEADIHIADYDTARWQDDFAKNNSNHEQPGDPVKLAELIYEVSGTENPPLHLPIGADAVASAMGLAEKITEDVSKWKDKAENTNYVK